MINEEVVLADIYGPSLEETSDFLLVGLWVGKEDGGNSVAVLISVPVDYFWAVYFVSANLVLDLLVLLDSDQVLQRLLVDDLRDYGFLE